jgi:hypothetical protein
LSSSGKKEKESVGIREASKHWKRIEETTNKQRFLRTSYNHTFFYHVSQELIMAFKVDNIDTQIFIGRLSWAQA